MWQRELEQFGFAVVPEALEWNEIQSLVDSLSEIGLSRSKAGIRHMLRHKATAAIAYDSRLMAMARHVLDTDATPFHATLFDKSPNANWLVVWHQDTALPLQERAGAEGWGPWSVKQGAIYAHAPATALQRVLALRVHLDDSTPENGPLRVLPETHKLGVLSDDSIQEIAANAAPRDCVVATGGILAMRPLIVHASSKSRTYAPRRVLHIEYAASMNIAEGLRLASA